MKSWKFHMKSVHENGVVIQECPICNKEIKHLKLHMKEHNESKTNYIKCDTCDKSFQSRISLKIHLEALHEKKKNHYVQNLSIVRFVFNIIP